MNHTGPYTVENRERTETYDDWRTANMRANYASLHKRTTVKDADGKVIVTYLNFGRA